MEVRRAAWVVMFFAANMSFSLTAVAQDGAASKPSSGIVQAIAIGLPIFAGVVGYFIVYWNNWRLEKRKSALKLVSDQLQYLYGPLFAANEAGTRAVKSLMSKNGLKTFYFEHGKRYSAASVKEYRLWMSEVFMPNNLRIEKIIAENAHLIEGEIMPEPFGKMLAHVASYKAVMKTWPDNLPSGEISYDEAIKQNTGALPFPQDLPLYVTRNFNWLKKRQMTLLGLVGQKNYTADFG